MIKCQIALLARWIIRDVETNTISVFSIVEQINILAFPSLGFDMSFFAYLRKDEADPKLLETKLQLRLDDELLFEVPIASDFGDKQANRIIVQIGGLLISKPGLLFAELFTKSGERLASYEARIMPINTKPTAKVAAGQ